jgi:hypothetical protein
MDTRSHGCQFCNEVFSYAAFAQLAFGNGATASDLFDFFEDNPGAVEAVINWVVDIVLLIERLSVNILVSEEDDEEVFDGDIEEANRYTVGD